MIPAGFEPGTPTLKEIVAPRPYKSFAYGSSFKGCLLSYKFLTQPRSIYSASRISAIFSCGLHSGLHELCFCDKPNRIKQYIYSLLYFFMRSSKFSPRHKGFYYGSNSLMKKPTYPWLDRLAVNNDNHWDILSKVTLNLLYI